MNIFLKAGNRIFGVPFQYEQFTMANRHTEHSPVYKLILDTAHTDLPFHQIIFTLPYLSSFEEALNADEKLYNQQMIIDIVHPELCINTFRQGEFFGSQFINILTGQYVLSAQMNCNELELAAYKGFVVEPEQQLLQI